MHSENTVSYTHLTSRMLILGDWIQDFSYAVFDGENMFLEQYVELSLIHI